MKKIGNKFPLLVNISISLPCYCGNHILIQKSVTAGETFDVYCPECGSSYGVEIETNGQVSVASVNISGFAQHQKVIASTCETLGFDVERLSVRNGRGSVDLVRFAQVLLETHETVAQEVASYMG